MADPRIAFGLTVEPDVQGPFEVRAASPGSPSEGGTLDCGIVARTADGRSVVIGEIWAACPGPGGSKVRIDARAVAERIVRALTERESP